MSGEQLLDCLNSIKKLEKKTDKKTVRSSSELVVWYFWAFCKVGIIREALRKARFYYMEIYLLLGLTGV